MHGLNPPQHAAVMHCEGPLLVLAGAGSGKTRVIVEKIGQLIASKRYPARRIAAITFTNKSAKEMRERVAKRLRGGDADEVTICTFHALGLKFLQIEHAAVGLKRGFSIFDADDSTAQVKDLMYGAKPDDIEDVKNLISRAKNAGLSPEQAMAAARSTREKEAASVYERYQLRLTAFNVLASDGNAHHFDEMLFAAKPHPGQMQIAARLRQDLHSDRPPRNEQRLQDRYSLRCAPHVIGVVQDALPFFRQLIETELNSANDNPLIDVEGERILHGGHFYGGHIAFAMDALKNTIANLADLLDRQMALVVDARFNHGLPANLSAATGERAAINHGLKALQISVSAWTAEALKQTMPASVFSRSTE